MYCTRCGHQLQDAAKFCPNCGKPAADDAAPTPDYIVPKRRLRRIAAQKKVAGVCAGFAEYFETDLTVMRLIWVGLAILPPSIGVIAYIIAWIAMPAE